MAHAVRFGTFIQIGQNVGGFRQNEISVLQILADQIAVAIENAQAFELSQKAVEELHEIDRISSTKAYAEGA